MLENLVDLDELLRVADLLSEEHEGGQLADHVGTDGDHAQLGLCLEPWVVHWEVDHLFVIDYGDQVGS